MKKQSIFIIISVTVLAVVMNIVDMLIKPQYFVKSLIKIFLFLVVPIIYFLLNRQDISGFKKLFKPNKKSVLASLLLGVICYGGIVGGYILLKDYIDFSNITKSLTADIGVNSDNFIFVALYISFINSFLEEFFFRGFAFITLKNHTGKKLAYIFSSVMFAFYHIGMTAGWVALPIFICGFAGLIAGGIIFNYLNDKKENIYSSWLVHMFINFGINTVGFMLFGII